MEELIVKFFKDFSSNPESFIVEGDSLIFLLSEKGFIRKKEIITSGKWICCLTEKGIDVIEKGGYKRYKFCLTLKEVLSIVVNKVTIIVGLSTLGQAVLALIRGKQ